MATTSEWLASVIRNLNAAREHIVRADLHIAHAKRILEGGA